MSFSSKRLRVRLPCGETTLAERGPAAPCNWVFATEAPTAATRLMGARMACEWPASDVDCTGFDSPGVCTPMFSVPACAFFSPTDGPNCGIFTPNCTPDTGIPAEVADPGTVLVDPDDLPQLREQLERTLKEVEARLREVADAQEQLKRR